VRPSVRSVHKGSKIFWYIFACILVKEAHFFCSEILPELEKKLKRKKNVIFFLTF
jgi:hypothetical protein